MIRSAFAALLAAAFACLIHDTVRERCRDAMLPNPDLSAVGLVAGVTALIWLLIMACRDPVERESCPGRCGAPARPPVSSAQVTVHVARDAAGRFVKANHSGESTAPLR